MKKVLFIVAFVLIGLGSVNAQNGSFNAGVNIGFPTGDISDFYSLAISAEANYLFEISVNLKLVPLFLIFIILEKKI